MIEMLLFALLLGGVGAAGACGDSGSDDHDNDDNPDEPESPLTSDFTKSQTFIPWSDRFSAEILSRYAPAKPACSIDWGSHASLIENTAENTYESSILGKEVLGPAGQRVARLKKSADGSGVLINEYGFKTGTVSRDGLISDGYGLARGYIGEQRAPFLDQLSSSDFFGR